MRLRVALLFSSLALAFAPASALAKEKEKSSKKERERESKKDKKSDKKKDREPERPKTPPSLALQSLDLTTSRAVALVGGVTKAPDSRLFSFHDDRDRHFIALNADCEAVKAGAPVEGVEAIGTVGSVGAVGEAMRCDLELPRDYARRGAWQKFTVRVSGREVTADPEVVKAVFEKARAALPPEPVAKSRPRAPIRRPAKKSPSPNARRATRSDATPRLRAPIRKRRVS